MKQFSQHNILLVAAVFLLPLFASCSSESELVPDGNASDKVAIQFTISDRSSDVTRATEPESGETPEDGNDKLNENTIDYLDLFVFKADGTLFTKKDETTGTELFSGHLSCDAKDFTITIEETDDGTTKTKKRVGKFNEGVLNLEYSELLGKDVYLIANWKLTLGDNISTKSELTARYTDALSGPKTKQEVFLMDGSAINVNNAAHVEDNVFNIDLARALAKIRIQVNMLPYEGSSKETQDITFGFKDASSTTTPIKYQLVNYATRSTIVDDGGEYAKTVSLTSYPQQGSSEELIKLTETSAVKDNGKAAFYSYPNNWCDASKLMYKEEPIDESRQTYLLLYAPYTEAITTTENGTEKTEVVTTWGYYKVPVNFRLQENNDKVGATVNENLYQLKRNHIYDVTVNIDRVGGPTSDDPTIIICDWEEGQTTEINYDSEFVVVSSSTSSSTSAKSRR